MKTTVAVAASLAAALLVSAAAAVPEGWHDSLEAGRTAARTSRKAVLVVTCWKPKV